MKNNFSKLRRQKRVAETKLNLVNKTVMLQIDEIAKLNKELDIKEITINSLKLKEKELSDKIYSMYNKLEQQTKMNNDNYNAWLEEKEDKYNLSIGITVMSFVIVGLVVALIGVWK